MDLSIYSHIPISSEPNFKEIPVNAFNYNDEDAHVFNQIYNFLKSRSLRDIVRTRSGGISYSAKHFSGPCWDVIEASTWTEITAIIPEGMFRFQIRTRKSANDAKIFGSTAFREFKKRLSEKNIDIDTYRIDNGPEIKKSIQKYPVHLDKVCDADVVFEHAYHIDFHSSFPFGLANSYPEFKEVINNIYEERHDPQKSAINKAILNYSIGYMQSIKCCNASWAHLSKAAIADNNKRVYELSDKVRENYKIILFNTDGFWYVDRDGSLGPYHGDGEGLGLGEWQNDHLDCKIRIKSPRSYEYIERDQYYPVVSGYTNLDKLKHRTEWEWGDIYRDEASVKEYEFIKGVGICRYGEDQPL